MRQLRHFITNLLVSEDGPTAVEYAVMIGLIFMVVLFAIQIFGVETASTFNTVSAQIAITNGS